MLEKLYLLFYAFSFSLKKLLSIVRVHEIYLLCLTLLKYAYGRRARILISLIWRR